jgi:gliding motility-associated protein GldM
MSGEKLSARQKMIGMMYLVLTAMLAMNISKEVLNGFVKVNDGLQTSNRQMGGQSNSIWSSFESKFAQNRDKVEPFYNSAKQVKERSDDMINYIKGMQGFSLASSSGDAPRWKDTRDKYIANSELLRADTVLGIQYISKMDEYQELTAQLVGPSPEKPREADEAHPYTALDLKNKLLEYSQFLQSIQVKTVDGKEWKPSQGILSGLENTFKYESGMEDDVEKSWEGIYFSDVPLAAVITFLSKLQLDVENAKTNYLADMIAGIEGKDYKFTTLKPLVIPETNYILRGDSFRADVILAAYDATNAPEIFVDYAWGQKDSSMYSPEAGVKALKIGRDGLGKLRIGTNGKAIGEHSFKGVIKYRGPDGSIEDHPFVLPLPYRVAEPSLVVSPSKMNVFYRGLPNPLEVSVPGVSQEALKVTCPGHTLTKDKDGWVIKPGTGSTADIIVSATMPDGTTQNMGKKEFRVKRIPDPVPKFAGKKPSDNTVQKNDMVIAAGVGAQMENFDFDVNVSVKSFNMVFIRDGQVIEKSSNSYRVTDEMVANMKKVKKGEKVYIESIIVTMPDGTTRQLSNISLKVV